MFRIAILVEGVVEYNDAIANSHDDGPVVTILPRAVDGLVDRINSEAAAFVVHISRPVLAINVPKKRLPKKNVLAREGLVLITRRVRSVKLRYRRSNEG
jgi:hypothetical protein